VWSGQGRVFWVGSSKEGSVSVIDPARKRAGEKIALRQGITQIRFSPDGRYAFVVNPKANEITILDAATNRPLQTFDTKPGPDQVTFTDTLAYIRHKGSDQVLMVPLEKIGRSGGSVPVVDFTGGNNAPGDGAERTAALGIVRIPGETAVLVANPKDQAIYYYMEGNAAPKGTFNNYGHQPLALQIIDRSLREGKVKGVYETSAILGEPGVYDLIFLMDSPRFVHCFPLTVQANPKFERERPVRLEFLTKARTPVKAGAKLALRFRAFEDETRTPKGGAQDVSVLIYLVPGTWRARVKAKPTEEPGVYAVDLVPPSPGVYYVHVESKSLKLALNGPDYLVLHADDE